MKFGFIPTEGGPFFHEALEEAVAGEALGFDSVWLEEHHGIRNHYWPSPLMALAGIATRTSTILLGTDIAVLPFYHPVRAAEDVAMLDILSGGRAIFGAAIGYRAPEFELYGAPLEGRGGRFVEMLQIMRGQVYTTRLPRYVSGFAIPHKTGDFLPYVGNDVGMLESRNRNIVICVFTAQHFGAGVKLADAVGRVAQLAANYFAARQYAKLVRNV